MFAGIAIAIGGALAALLGYAATRPNSFRVERSAMIDAPPEKIFPFITDFHQWTAWSPWEKIDPGLKRSYEGATEGVGAAYSWEGNSKVGAGRMEIQEATPPSRIAIKLDFTRPFKANNRTQFHLEPQGAGSRVTWGMDGENQFMGKVMGVFMNMDKLVGKDFEAGLANLKSLAEK